MHRRVNLMRRNNYKINLASQKYKIIIFIHHPPLLIKYKGFKSTVFYGVRNMHISHSREVIENKINSNN